MGVSISYFIAIPALQFSQTPHYDNVIRHDFLPLQDAQDDLFKDIFAINYHKGI